MPRAPTIEYPNAFYHVMSRGVNKQDLFKSERDFKVFLYLLKETHKTFNIRIHSFCLMPNHYHLFIQTPDANLAKAMKHLNQSYAEYFLSVNPDKDGHVFKGRYKKKLVECLSYAKHLFRYISLNPVKAKLVENAQEWEWSSFKNFQSDNFINYSFLDYEFILTLFSKNPLKARALIKSFCEISIETLEKPTWNMYKIIAPINDSLS